MWRLFAFAAGVALLLGSAVPTSQGVSITQPPPTDADGRTDLYGNEISAAVATYSLDADGAIYEVHSPQTEIPRLGSPKS
jgi:hypothetical protein